jgi:DNA-binding protein
VVRIQEGEGVAVCGRGKDIARVIDVLELIRRRVQNDIEIELEETVIDEPEGIKSDILSVLNAEIDPN